MGRHAGVLTAASAGTRKFSDDGPHLSTCPSATSRSSAPGRREGHAGVATADAWWRCRRYPRCVGAADHHVAGQAGRTRCARQHPVARAAVRWPTCCASRSRPNWAWKRVRGEHLRLPAAQLPRLRPAMSTPRSPRGRRESGAVRDVGRSQWLGGHPALRRLRGRLPAGAAHRWGGQDAGEGRRLYRRQRQRRDRRNRLYLARCSGSGLAARPTAAGSSGAKVLKAQALKRRPSTGARCRAARLVAATRRILSGLLCSAQGLHCPAAVRSICEAHRRCLQRLGNDLAHITLRSLRDATRAIASRAALRKGSARCIQRSSARATRDASSGSARRADPRVGPEHIACTVGTVEGTWVAQAKAADQAARWLGFFSVKARCCISSRTRASTRPSRSLALLAAWNHLSTTSGSCANWS